MLQKLIILTLVTQCVALRFKLNTAMNLQEDWSPTCTLDKMQKQVYLISQHRTSEPVLSENFLNHYKRLGVDMENNLHLVIHTETPDGLGRMQEMFNRIGVKPKIETISRWSSDIKRSFVNAFISDLPKDAWVIYADADEFFNYPCQIFQKMQEGKDCFSARMADRIGQNFTIQEMQVMPNLHKLNPMKCPNLREHFHAWSFKQIIFKAWGPERPRHMKNAHEAGLVHLLPGGMDLEKLEAELIPKEFLAEAHDDEPAVQSYDTGTFFDHYFWTKKTMGELILKMRTYRDSGPTPSASRVDHYHEMFDIIDHEQGQLNQAGRDLLSQVCFYDP